MESFHFLWVSLTQAVSLLLRLDPPLISIIDVSLRVAFTALLIGSAIAIPIAVLLTSKNFPGRQFLRMLINVGMGLPSVIAGVVVLLLLTARGPFGAFNLLWTPTAMVISQTVLITPLITGVMISSLLGVDQRVKDAAVSLGANRAQRALVILREAHYGMLTALMAGFGRAIAEVGSVIMVGGNIAWADGISHTRTLTTAMILEVRRGNFEQALALGIILLTLVLVVNWIAIWLQRRAGR
ncbi:ABC transporter permease [Candidatus Acetothermia bacterium]|jgi:tungstate transport system permease protein|nr:ABC transporter permease [Candidatus Acetothermia bacterium]MCI2426732.1 ABC transporter permease [Candidatus Acetothermia bacterium]MCI2427463.1 ABC transporter permease [Candidatus Acetothermia bacterium]MCI2428856.1 ABC transporter permease [Candidatus Acetothermia bacterium]